MPEHTPHPANVPGDFYVEDGCCTMCEVPFAEAPELFGTGQDSKGYLHCYVKRQPVSLTEHEQLLSAMRCAELKCIRYRGSDRLIQLRLIDRGAAELCDCLRPDIELIVDYSEPDLHQQCVENHRVREAEPSQHVVTRRPWWRFW